LSEWAGWPTQLTAASAFAVFEGWDTPLIKQMR
jgi:hypothetical protein